MTSLFSLVPAFSFKIFEQLQKASLRSKPARLDAENMIYSTPTLVQNLMN